MSASWLPIVPDGTNSARSLPSRSATRVSSALTVGSSPYTSSPTSALAIASRMPRDGRVTVSDRRSRTSMAANLTAKLERSQEQLVRDDLGGLRQVDRRLIGGHRNPDADVGALELAAL